MNTVLDVDVLSSLAVPGRREQGLEPEAALRVWWLGQAGFLFQNDRVRILVDPYLSDALAKKYAGTRFPHRRMVPPPIEAEELQDIDAVFCTHAHSDHMDPEALAIIGKNNPTCRFIVPRSSWPTAVERGIPTGRLVGMDAGESVRIGESVSVAATASAHETLRRDADGHDLFLGYVIDFGGLRIYHSGDCVPYPGLVETLRPLAIDAAFLPVNGRDQERTSQGIAGNFTLSEALDLVLDVPMGLGIGHHFGLFDFNTIDPKQAHDYLVSRHVAEGRFILVSSESVITLSPSPVFSLTSAEGVNRIGS